MAGKHVDTKRVGRRRAKKVLLGILAVALLAAVVFLIYGTRAFQMTSAERLEDQYSQHIPPFKSSVDADADSIDDQSDILQGALDYVAQNPKYKSRYYAQTGYPDDNYGVCVDVVGAALRNAGYDLMELVQEDIAAYPESYDIAEPDPAIDFRRVPNLRTFFNNNAIRLTTDLNEIEQWQGGDIVVFKNHIGIVSDRRNARGIPYVIHLNDPFQKTYEEDILESRSDLTDHFRMSTLDSN